MTGQKKILVVEDEMTVAHNMCRWLERCGYTVIGPVHDAQNAIQTALEKKPNLVLMDIRLDENADGIEAVEELNRQMDIPVIYITAHSDKKTFDRAKETAPYGYLLKPFGENEMLLAIDMVLYKHQTQQEIKRRERELATILKSIEDAVIATDADLLITYVNPSAEILLETALDEILGKNIKTVCRIIYSENVNPSSYSYPEIMAAGKSKLFPEGSLLRSNDGVEIPVSGSYSVILNDLDEPSGIVLTLRDVSGERKAEEARKTLRTVEEAGNEIRNRLIKDSHPDMKVVLSLLAKVGLADRAVLCLYSTEDKTEETVEWLHPKLHSAHSRKREEGQVFSEWWMKQVTKGKPLQFEDINKMSGKAKPEKDRLHKEGVRSMIAFPFRSKEAGYLGYIELAWMHTLRQAGNFESHTLLMMSELISSSVIRSKIEKRARNNENRFRTLIQNSSDIITVLNPDAVITYASTSVKRLLGYEPEELVGENVFHYIHKDDLKKVRESFRKIVEEGFVELTVEYRFKHKDGHWLYLESVGSNLLNNPAVAGVVANTRDINDRKHSETELIHARDIAEEMNRLKTALLANMSHEMRTPLTGILGFASILESDLPEGESKEMATRIHISGRRLLETIESILELAKLEAEKIETQLENVNIIDEISRAMEAHSRSARYKGLDFKIHTDLKELNVEIDRQILNRIMYNLLSNAFKYTDEGEVSVHISRVTNKTGEWVQIDVQDTGVGISPDFLPKIFDEFQQESTGLSRKFEGSGLGLSITRKLVDVMGGTITVNSKKGVGSIFTIRFPRRATEETRVGSGTQDKEALRDKILKPRILLVEDDFDSATITKFYLMKKYDVEVVDSGEKALDKLKNDVFNMVIMDISLGVGMDGVDTLKSIQSNKIFADLPVITLTAHALSGDADYYIEQGFSAYLSKPFRKEELLRLVQKFIS
ncbi:MAG: response regulator [Balneolales bacterium]